MEINRARRKILQDVSQKLRQLRSELGYSPKEMAARLGVQTVTYYRNESGDSLLNLVSLRKMQREFGISMDWLLFGSGPRHLEEKTKKKKQAEPELPQEPVVVEKRPAWEESMPDAKELLDHMAEDPLFRHKVLLFFYEYKNQKELAAQPTRQQEPAPEPDRE